MTEQSPLTLIQNRKLPTAVRGYDRAATDQLLDDLKTTVTTLISERNAAQARVKEFESRLAALEEREKDVTEAIVVASRVRAEAENEAKQRAEERIRAAEAEAEQLVAQARASARTFEQEAHEAEQVAARARRELTMYLESLLAEVEQRGADLGSIVHDLVKRAGDAAHAGADGLEMLAPRPSEEHELQAIHPSPG